MGTSLYVDQPNQERQNCRVFLCTRLVAEAKGRVLCQLQIVPLSTGTNADPQPISGSPVGGNSAQINSLVYNLAYYPTSRYQHLYASSHRVRNGSRQFRLDSLLDIVLDDTTQKSLLKDGIISGSLLEENECH